MGLVVLLLVLAFLGAAYDFPTSAELEEVEKVKLPRLTEERLGFRVCPMVNVEAHLLEWEQEDDWTGLQNARGMGGPFTRVKKKGVNRYAVVPGVYGESMGLDELELTTKREIGTFGRPINVRAEVMRLQDRLLERRLDRVESIIWTLLGTGSYSVSGDDGPIHVDSYSLQTQAAAVAWATVATATPLVDFRAVALKARGKGCTFGRQATAYMNRVTFNNLVANTNANDLGGRFTYGGNPFRGVEDVNRILAQEDLPVIAVYDEGYLTDAGVWTPFIANSKVIVVGRRTNGSKVMDYAMTRNANNPNLAPGPYREVIERREPPKGIDVYDGHNGGLRVYFPSAICILTVS